jgi:hypothetical protein
MSASEQQRTEWLDNGFWERLERLEVRHRRAQAQHDEAQRRLERLSSEKPEELGVACGKASPSTSGATPPTAG